MVLFLDYYHPDCNCHIKGLITMSTGCTAARTFLTFYSHEGRTKSDNLQAGIGIFSFHEVQSFSLIFSVLIPILLKLNSWTHWLWVKLNFFSSIINYWFNILLTITLKLNLWIRFASYLSVQYFLSPITDNNLFISIIADNDHYIGNIIRTIMFMVHEFCDSD